DTPVSSLKPNQLVIHIAPDEGISMRFGAKVPGAQMKVGSVEMDFNYSDYFGTEPNTGYEVLLYDCIRGDQTLFQRAAMVDAGWRVDRGRSNVGCGESWAAEEFPELSRRLMGACRG